MNMKTSHYTLQCLACGKEYKDSEKGFLLTCPEDHSPALLRAQYVQKIFEIRQELPGIFRFANWLPARRILDDACGPTVFHSNGLGRLLGLENLFIVFSGYWPEKGAFLETCTFKELEALAVCARIPEGENRPLVIASAGNTGRAFLHICSAHAIPAVIVVPEIGQAALWMTREKHACVKTIVLKGDVDYFDTIRLGNLIAESEGYFSEGGVKNVARRDGLGSVLLAVVERTGQIPAHYFQAVGSGTGGIAAWEMRQRVLHDGRFGTTGMALHLSQNAPFTPLVDAWNAGSHSLLPMNEVDGKQKIRTVRAQVLTNRHPPYSLVGGVYDALIDSSGSMYAVSNEDAATAGAIFLQEEGCDLDPAAEVAVASLFQAVEMQRIGTRDLVALNITGGGRNILEREKRLRRLEPDIIWHQTDLNTERVFEQLQTCSGH
jgi:cysteate synthase